MRKTDLFCLMALMALLVSLVIVSWNVPAQASNEKIIIGVVEAMSGPFKYTGERFLNGVKFAAAKVNAQGGLFGKKLEVIVEDHAFKADVGVRKATKLILEDKADFLVGSLGAHVALAVMQVAEKHKKIYVVYGSEAPGITGKDFSRYTFRNTLNADQRYNALFAYFQRTKFKKYYLFNPDYVTGREGGAYLKKKMKGFPSWQLVGEDYHPLGLRDFSPYVSKIIASSAEVVLTTDFGADLSNLIKTGHALGWKLTLASGYLADPVILQDVKEAAIGHVVVDDMLDFNNTEFKRWVQEFFEEYKDLDKVLYSPIYATKHSFYGTMWLLDVIKKTGSLDSEKIIEGWEGMSYNFPWAKVTMRACDHQIRTPIMGAVIEPKSDLFQFPFTGKPIIIPEEEISVPPVETGNPNCR